MQNPEEEKRAGLVTYTVDASNRIVAVGGDWDRFARENSAPELSGERILGRPITDFLSPGPVVALVNELLERVRARGTAATIPFRCDSPELLRRLELTLTPLADGGVEFRSATVIERPHPHALRILDPSVPRSDDHLTLCAWCRSVSLPEWVELDEAIRRLQLLETLPLPMISHGICPACEELMMSGSASDARAGEHAYDGPRRSEP